MVAVLYHIPCTSCPHVYIGQTGHTLEYHLKEHKIALTSDTPISSTIAEHAINTYHDTDWANVSVVDWANVSVVDSHPHLHAR